jgi:DNA-binding CsgD family transcriptional regulator
MSLTLSSADLRRLDVAATTILAPEADLDLDAWRLAVNASLRELVGGATSAFIVASPDGVEAVSSDTPPTLLRVFEAITGTPRDGSRGRLTASYAVASLDDIVAGEWDAYRHDPAVNEIFLPNDIRDVVAFDMHWSESDGAKTGVRVAVYHDRYGSPRYGETGAAMCRLLLPALRSAVSARIRQRLQFHTRTAELCHLLDALPGGALLTDATGRTLHESPGLARLLATDVERARLRHALECATWSLVLRLRRARQVDATDARRQAAAGAATEVRTAMARYDVRATYTRAISGDAHVIVMLERMTPPATNRDRLRERFLLTPREVEVAERLSLGHTNGQIARAMGVTGATARRHTEHVFAKLGVTTRSAVGARIRQGD